MNNEGYKYRLTKEDRKIYWYTTQNLVNTMTFNILGCTSNLFQSTGTPVAITPVRG